MFVKNQKKKNPSTITKINPINKEEEKRKFFFDPKYNPQFEYAYDFVEEEVVTKYGNVSNTLLKKAVHILDTVIQKYTNESSYLKQTEGELMERAEVERVVQDYLQNIGLRKKVSVRFSRSFIARTSTDALTLKVRLPIEYRKKTFLSVLDHEIGTHVLRWLNEKNQPWCKNRREYNLSRFLETEEGLATIHQYIRTENKYLWLRALSYYAVYYGSQLSFSDLYKKLSVYIDDPERCWRRCLRVKRGIKDTSKPLAFSKDQLYFSGVIKVIDWLEKNDYNTEKLYWGKIALEDIERAYNISSDFEPQLPVFLQNKKVYIQQIREVKKLNKLS